MRQSPGAPSTCARRKGTQVFRPANQVRSGRRLQDRVAYQQPLKPGGIGVLERRDVLVQQGTGLRPGRLRDLISCRAHVREPCPGALQRTLHRRGRAAQHDRNLGGGERQYIPQHQHGPLPGRQILQASNQRQPQPRTGGNDDSGIGPTPGSPPRPEPAPARQHPDPRLPAAPRHPVRARTGPMAASAVAARQGRQARIGRDLIEPGAHRGPALETRRRSARPAGRFPGPDPRRPEPSPACGSSARTVRGAAARPARRTPQHRAPVTVASPGRRRADRPAPAPAGAG